MYVVEIFIPVSGKGNSVEELAHLIALLTGHFGGATAFTRSPAQGAWQAPTEGSVERDDIVVVETMAETLDKTWWRVLCEELELKLDQKEILVRAHEIQRL
jgi:hypothetical protein